MLTGHKGFSTQPTEIKGNEFSRHPGTKRDVGGTYGNSENRFPPRSPLREVAP